jgi:hypothetical protein
MPAIRRRLSRRFGYFWALRQGASTGPHRPAHQQAGALPRNSRIVAALFTAIRAGRRCRIRCRAPSLEPRPASAHIKRCHRPRREPVSEKVIANEMPRRSVLCRLVNYRDTRLKASLSAWGCGDNAAGTRVWAEAGQTLLLVLLVDRHHARHERLQILNARLRRRVGAQKLRRAAFFSGHHFFPHAHG